jgi:hypothetical protein
MSNNAVEIASLVRQIVLDTLKASAPGIAEQMREAIANSVTIKLRAVLVPHPAASPPEQPPTPDTVKMLVEAIDAKNARIAQLEEALGKAVLSEQPAAGSGNHMTDAISDDELAGWARNWHWNDCADDGPVDPSIYFRDARMLKAFITKFEQRLPRYLSNCLRAGACHGKCESTACTNYGKDIVIRKCVEPTQDGVLYPGVET